MVPTRLVHGSTSLTSIQTFCHVLLPCPRYVFAQSLLTSSVGTSDYLLQINFIKTRSVFVQNRRCQRWHGTMRQMLGMGVSVNFLTG